MTDEVKPIAKSLHTIKVIQQVAAHILSNSPRPLDEIDSPTVGQKAAAIGAAMGVLGLSGRPDPYELEEKALRLWK